MKKKFLTLFFTFLLTLTTSAVVAANTEPAVNYEYGSQSINMIETSKGHILITQAETDYDTWHNHYTIMRYDADGTQYAKLALGAGAQYYAKYNGKAYIVFLDYKENTINIYNEAFELLKALPVDSSNIAEELELKSIENELIYFVQYGKGATFAVSLKDLAITMTAPRKMDSAYIWHGENGLTLTAYDQYETALPPVTIAGNFSEQAVYSHPVIYNDHIYVASTTDQVNVLKISFEGKVISTTPVALPAGTAIDAASLIAVAMDDKILFYEQIYDESEKAIVFVYNMTTEQIEFTDTKTGGVMYQYYGNNKLREFSFGQNAATIFYDTSFNQLFELNMQQGDSLVYPGGNYLIINKQTETAYTSVLHDFTTGKPIRTIFTSDDVYNPTGVNEALLFDSNTSIYYVVQPNSEDVVEHDAQGYFTQVANKGSVTEIKPTPIGQVVEPTKNWTATLTQAVDPTSVTNETVIVKNAKGEQIDVTFSVEGKKIIITAPENGYAVGNYTLTLQDLKSATGKTLKKATTKKFSVQ